MKISSPLLKLFMIGLLNGTHAQSTDCCDELHTYYDSLHVNLTTYIDESPRLISESSLKEVTTVNSELEGEVYISFLINENGHPFCLVVKKSTDFQLNEKALETIHKLKFKPARQKGEAIVSKMTLPVIFRST